MLSAWALLAAAAGLSGRCALQAPEAAWACQRPRGRGCRQVHWTSAWAWVTRPLGVAYPASGSQRAWTPTSATPNPWHRLDRCDNERHVSAFGAYRRIHWDGGPNGVAAWRKAVEARHDQARAGEVRVPATKASSSPATRLRKGRVPATKVPSATIPAATSWPSALRASSLEAAPLLPGWWVLPVLASASRRPFYLPRIADSCQRSTT